MICCDHCRDADDFFGRKGALREARRYRRRGPLKSTRLLLDALLNEGVGGASLLDVGGGIGAVQFELLEAGVALVTHVDASAGYLEVAREEAERRGVADRIAHLHGDFVGLAAQLPEADLVTLDRVLCCYPHLEALVEASTGRARRLLGIVIPRARLGTRWAMALGNRWFRLRGSDFRVYLHSPERVDALIRERGFRRVGEARTFLWEAVTYRREGSPPPGSSAPGV